MKTWKKILTVILCIALVMSLATMVLATESAVEAEAAGESGGNNITMWILLSVAALVFGMGSAFGKLKRK